MKRKEYENRLNQLLARIQELENSSEKDSLERIKQLRNEVARLKLENLNFSNILG
jgi:hypothetical protein